MKTRRLICMTAAAVALSCVSASAQMPGMPSSERYSHLNSMRSGASPIPDSYDLQTDK